MLVEASSVLHEIARRGEVRAAHADTMLQRLLQAPVEIRAPTGLIAAAWTVADDLGWAKTYDAQYVALAQMLGCKLVTLDERLIRASRGSVSQSGRASSSNFHSAVCRCSGHIARGAGPMANPGDSPAASRVRPS
jgi:hypothetical protein